MTVPFIQEYEAPECGCTGDDGKRMRPVTINTTMVTSLIMGKDAIATTILYVCDNCHDVETHVDMVPIKTLKAHFGKLYV